MIDLRSHILDSTPCGPDSFAESLEMCRAAAADGVRTLVATPLWEAGCQEPPLPFDECRRKLKRLEAELRGALTLRLGFVLRFSAELPALVERHGPKLALAGGGRVLVSLPSVEIPEGVCEVWESLARSGLSVILAHPECSAVLRRDSARLARWVSEGVALQVDAASVLGAHGREVQRFALECLRKYKGRVVVASNARGGAGQSHSLGSAREDLSGRMGGRLARSLTSETPAALIGDGERRGIAQRGLGAVLRSFGPIRALTGES